MPTPILLLALLWLTLPAGGCLAWEVSNRVVIEHGTLTIDHSKTVREITQAQAKGGFAAAHGLGLFQNRIKTELEFTPPAGAAKRLALSTRITTSPIIYVASEFAEDSCGYGVVLGHERLHQLFDLEVLRAMPAEIRAMSQDVFAVDELERVGTRNLEQSRSRFFQQFKYHYDALSAMRHPRIDNPESYRHLGTLCNGEIARRLASDKP